MNDQYFNFNFPTRPILTSMHCENTACPQNKIQINKCDLTPNICSSCFKLYCLSCFQTPIHDCSNKACCSFSDSINTIPCSRCKTNTSTYFCINCNSEYFCNECCQMVHKTDKFSFHSVSEMNSVRRIPNEKNEILKQNNSPKVGQVLSHFHFHHKKSPSYAQLESLKLNMNFQQQQNFVQQQEDSKIKQQWVDAQSFEQIGSKLQISQSLISMKKSQIKLAELSLKQKWQKINSTIQETFNFINHKLKQKQQSIKTQIQQQFQVNMKEMFFMKNIIKSIQIQTVNVKYLIGKNQNKKTINNIHSNDFAFMKIINQKFQMVDQKINSLQQKNIEYDFKAQISKEFTNTLKKLQRQIDSLNVDFHIRHNIQDQQKFLVKNFDQSSNYSHLKDKKKPLIINTSSKYTKKTDNNILTTKKNLNNISFSQQLNNIESNLKTKKRKTSIQLYETGINNQGKFLQPHQKGKQLQRIKSYDFLSSTMASFSSSNQIKTQKKLAVGRKQILQISTNLDNKELDLKITNNNSSDLATLRIDSKRQTESQKQQLHFIQNTGNDTSIFLEEGQSMNFLTTSSELLPSIESFILPAIQTTRPKESLNYGGYTKDLPKNNVVHNNMNKERNLNINVNKERTFNTNIPNTNSNKTFSGSTVTSSLKSPINKILTSGFKSPKAKIRHVNQKVQESFNQLSQFDPISIHTNTTINKEPLNTINYNKQRQTIKKTPSTRILINLNKQ